MIAVSDVRVLNPLFDVTVRLLNDAPPEDKLVPAAVLFTMPTMPVVLSVSAGVAVAILGAFPMLPVEEVIETEEEPDTVPDD